jgi:hypothetical protein
MDWSKTLKWLADNPSAGPGGDPDLFDMPLPERFPNIEGQEWPFAPEWDGQCEGPIGGSWGIGKTGYFVVVTDREAYIRGPKGFRV